MWAIIHLGAKLLPIVPTHIYYNGKINVFIFIICRRIQINELYLQLLFYNTFILFQENFIPLDGIEGLWRLY